ncbi:MAG: D-alanyl-D-alanine carboxypeptidase family protein [Lachnospiraceae bacterium]
MKCINKRIAAFLCTVMTLSVCLTGCGNAGYSMSYDMDSSVSAYRFQNSDSGNLADLFAHDLCVISEDVSVNSVDTSQAEAALLCSINDKTVLYGKNANVRMDPASLTKVMTAIVALKNGNLDDILTASENVEISEPGASLVGIKAGDTMTLDQALHALLMPSGNDAAVLIAEYIAGSEAAFVDMMNEEAAALGATNCHFMNSHGLTAENHYITAYDMYLIFNEAIKYDEFVQIITASEYSGVYHDAAGEPKELSFSSTNQFINGNHEVPDGVVVIGGKTGTTNAAGNCLVLLSKDSSGNPYISVILKCSQRDYLYDEMYNLIDLVNQ